MKKREQTNEERRRSRKENEEEINYEPCVLPKFIQFTRIDGNDDDSHLACVWRAKAIAQIGVMHSNRAWNGIGWNVFRVY